MNEETNATPSGKKLLSQKTDAELKRETKDRLRYLDPMIASQLVNEVVGKQAVGGFVNFLREYAIVGLAVGFVLGTQVQTVVRQFIASFIDPLFQLFFTEELSKRKFNLYFSSHHHADFAWGAVAYDMIDFLFVTAAIYIIIKIFKLDKLDKK